MTTPLLVQCCRHFGTLVHLRANHHYGDKPYEVHLEQVAYNAARWGPICGLTVEETFTAQAAAWLHDSIEDARQTYNDVLEGSSSVEVANIVYALTNEKGRSRAERASDVYYDGIVVTPLATFVKLCDRLANVTASDDIRMLNKYAAEHSYFRQMLLLDRQSQLHPLDLAIEERFRQTVGLPCE